jgi:hypothetical protein
MTSLERNLEIPNIGDGSQASLERTNNTGEKKGVNPCKLLNDTYLHPHTGRPTGVHQTMSGVPVDTRSDAFQIMYQNCIAFLPSLHMETQAKIDEFISEEFENDIRSGRQTLGPLYAVERLQEIKIALQNKLMLRRTQIKKKHTSK